MVGKGGVQADGLVTKCDRTVTALMYLKMERTPIQDHRRRAQLNTAIDCVDAWKRTWRADKGKRRMVAIAESMETVPDMTTTKEIIQCRPLWDDFDAVCEALEFSNCRVEEVQLKICTGAIAGLLQTQSVQRPSAIIGATTAT